MYSAPLSIEYNQEFDKTYYKIQEKHEKALAKIDEFFRLSCDSAFWSYDATIHGRIFTFTWKDGHPPANFHPYMRLGVEQLQFLASVPEFRWMEIRDNCRLVIALEH